MRFFIVDDEPLARLRLRQLMGEVSETGQCVAEAADGLEALAMLSQSSADVLFLDVEFPPDGAFGLLDEARKRQLKLPAVILTTAYSRYALEAFRWAVVDYLLKPLDGERLGQALKRVHLSAPNLEVLREAIEAVRQKKLPERFVVNTRQGFRVVHWKEVSHVDTENRLVLVNTAEGRFVLDRTMHELEVLLRDAFLRVHRSALVNVALVRSVTMEGDGAATVHLSNGCQVPVSRDRVAEVKRRLVDG
jgi:DNA-binding LytR/AlgR family response regulator